MYCAISSLWDELHAASYTKRSKSSVASVSSFGAIALFLTTLTKRKYFTNLIYALELQSNRNSSMILQFVARALIATESHQLLFLSNQLSNLLSLFMVNLKVLTLKGSQQ